jgi:hypothetical protein
VEGLTEFGRARSDRADPGEAFADDGMIDEMEGHGTRS